MNANSKFTIALPKGRILDVVLPILSNVGIEPEASFFDNQDRKLSRMVVAAQKEMVMNEDPRTWSHVRVATKYPNITRRHFEARGVHAECIKLNGAMELAPSLGLCRRIVDLVESGNTLAANGLVEVEEICKVSTRLAVNRSFMKTNTKTIQVWIDKVGEVLNG